MKTIYNKLLLLVLLFPLSILAQSTFTGTVLDQVSNQPIPGVNVVVEGTQNGTSTDFDGKFSLNVKKGDNIVFSYIGYKNYTLVYTAQKDIAIRLQEDASQLDEVVVIGYGSVKKKDATGSLTTISTEDFNRGPLVSADQLIQGKVSGLQIINGGGAPGEGAQIRIRSGSSLSAENNPLYVVDGVPLDNGGGGVQGGRNPLSAINQNDIESVTVLKDASATAIYGSRASNGVIIITTKKGKSGDMKVHYNANFSVGQVSDYVEVLNSKQFSDFVMLQGSPAQQALLGTANTDWQKEIYRTALGTDHNVAFSGGVDNINYRASVGYSDLSGILKEDNFQRVTLNTNLLGKFFDNHLKVEFTNKTSSNKNNYSNREAIGAAVSFDPTQNVYDTTYGYDYFQWLDFSDPNVAIPNQEVNASRNPLSLIEQKTNKGTQYRSIGNVQFDYKLHFLPELKAVANFGYDYSSGKGYGSTAANYVVSGQRSSNYNNLEEKKNRVMDLYLNYNKTFDAIKTNLDFTGGYNYQNFNYINSSFVNDVVNNVVIPGNSSNETVNLQSVFARAIFSINDKYLLTGSIRRDGSSRFSEDNRWGNFPSAAIAWKINEESILKDSKIINDLKLRASWGITGQQEIGKRYPTTPLYLNSTETASYQIGYDASGVPVYLQPYRPQPYNLNLKWEETKQLNIGLDFGLFDNRITGTAEVYKKNSNDLIVFTSNPQGVGFSNADFYNIGDMEFKGIELSMDVYPVRTDNVKWRIGGNITFQDSEVTKLNLVQSADSQGLTDVGGISGGTGNYVQNHQVGFAPFSFYVLEQTYDVNGAPVEGVYVDRNQDGQINENDLYRYKKPAADFYYGFNTDFQYKNFDFNMSWRGSYGNYNYNNVYSNFGNVSTSLPGNGNYLNNASTNVLETNFVSPQYASDYYVQDASFLRLDNVTLGYSFPNALGEGKNLRLTGAVQNVFIITDYKGIDPEVSGGIDNNLYPRPRTYTLGLNLNF
ncbi:SusC/RagA family TonB-linked outer membrane protein [Flavobacterium tegetincola]|uniref:SusC/RagA family TonB-linked outer membrane protein n=1 Tax=Flavobacterium tegetincola TaxID=150172 RepID=UPI0004129EB3|nr:TonB-dependent receptor [Flavobacterium tegetincola]